MQFPLISNFLWEAKQAELLQDPRYRKPYYPPYAKSINKPVPGNNLVWVIVGEDWELAKSKRSMDLPVILILSGMPLNNMILPIKNFEVLIVDSGIPSKEFIEALFFKLITAGASFIYTASLNNDELDNLQWSASSE